MKFEFSAGGIVYKKEGGVNLFALILNSYGEWTFPKGHIEKNEKPEAAAVREVKEEIGLSNLSIIELLDKIDYFFKFEGALIHKYVYFYLMTAASDAKIIPQEVEVKDAGWFKAEDVKKKLKYKEDIILFEKVSKSLKI